MMVRRSLVLMVVATVVAAPGCSGKREHAEESRQIETGKVQRSEPPVRVGAAAGNRGESANELFSRIHDHESKLSQTITSNRLDEVGREAFLIRDFTVTAANQANVPVNQRAELEQHVSTVRRVATDLSKAGKDGDLDEVKARNSEFQRELGIIERMIGQVGGSSLDTE